MSIISIKELWELPRSDFFVTRNGKVIEDWTTLKSDEQFRVHLRVLGGKGGFGSLLRSFRINRSTNQLMCRDLSGRRLADVKEEERLKKWIANKAQREADKQQRQNEKYERLKRGPPKHQFDDQDYMKQKEEILEKTDDAFEQGIKTLKAECSSSKRSSDGDFVGKRRTEEQLFSAEQNASSAKRKKPSDETYSVQNSDSLGTNVSEQSDSETGQIEQLSDGQLKKTVHHFDDEIKREKVCQPIEEEEEEEEEEENKSSVVLMELAPIDLDCIEKAQDLEAFGLDHLKQALQARDMKCGGCLSERATRLFSVKGLSADHYPKSVLTKKK